MLYKMYTVFADAKGLPQEIVELRSKALPIIDIIEKTLDGFLNPGRLTQVFGSSFTLEYER